jgi:GPH family glycoside/pentoside/hexuronide:cation symporter
VNSDPISRDHDRVSVSTIVVYAAPVGAVFFSSFLISTFFMKFATDYLLIAPAVAGTILLVGQGWDAINDPPIGYWSDRTRTRWGRRRPWFVASAIPLALCTVALWSPPTWLDETQIVAWTLVVFLLYRTFYSTFRVPHLALGAEISRGYHDRTRVFGGSQLVETIGLLGATATIGIVENAVDPRETMARISVYMAIAIVAFLLGASAYIREPESHQKPDEQGPFAVFAQVLRNPHARIILLIFLLEQAGLTLLLGTMPYFSDWVLRTPGQTAVYMGTAVLTMLVTIPVWVLLSRRYGKKEVWLVSKVLRIALLANVWVLGEGDTALFLVGCVLIGGMASCGTVIGPSIKADIIDWDEARSGGRREGAYFATWNFAQKGAGALGGWLLGVSLAAFGYDALLPDQSAQTILGIQFALAYIPLVLTSVSVALLWRFSLDERAHGEAVAAAGARGERSSPE